MTMILEFVITITLVIGGLFTLVGSYGLLKLNTPMARVHAPTKASTLGVGSILLAAVASAIVYEEGSVHELLIMAFIFVTAPISAHFIAKVHIHHGETTQELPDPPKGHVWATRNVAPDSVAGERQH